MRGIAMAIIWLGLTIDMRFDQRWQQLPDDKKEFGEHMQMLIFAGAWLAIIFGL